MNNTSELTLKINGMHCASCVNSIEKGLIKSDGIIDCKVNLALNSAVVKFNSSTITKPNIIENITKLGFGAEVGKPDILTSNKKQLKDASLNFRVAFGFSVPLMFFSMYPMFVGDYVISSFIDGISQAILSAIVLFWSGRSILKDAFNQLKYFRANMNSLVALGTLTAFFWSIYIFYNNPQNYHEKLYFESAGMIIALILLGKFLEARSKGRAGEAIKALVKLQPSKTLALINNVEIEIDAASAQIGMELIVRPGERVPADGMISEANPIIDESMLTGESMPVEKSVGDEVIGGSLNGNVSFNMKVTNTGEKSFLSSIIRLVSDAQSKKAPVQKLADKVAGVFVPIVILISILTFTGWYFYDPSSPMLIKGFISVLIIACPCALGLATPTAILAGTGRAAKEGIIIRGGDILENISKLDTIIFDKTGTLTYGKLDVIKIQTFGDMTDRNLLKIIGSAEIRSEHPVAKALVGYMKREQIEPANIKNVEALPGFGIKADWNGRPLLIGNRLLLEKNQIKLGKALSESEKEMSQGRTVIFASLDSHTVGMVVLSDRLRSESTEVISKLKANFLKIMMITGDNSITAQGISSLAGIDDFFAEIRPEQKKYIVESCRKSGANVAMIGDGINDAPALAMANIGVAIGSGTDIAIETADVVLVRSHLDSLLKMLKISKSSMNIIKQNLFWAFSYNIIAIPLAAGLFYPFFGISLSPMIAAGAMAFSSVFVVSNSLRLNNIKL